MKRIILLTSAAIFFFACTNNSTQSTTIESKDSVTVKDSTDAVENNVVTPPASNGQF